MHLFFVHHYTNLFIFFKLRSFEDFLIYAAGGENKTFIGSADWMPRNLDNRVEVITPVYDSRIKEDLWKVIDFGLRGNCQGSVVDGSGKNCLWTTDTEESFRSQEELYKYYKSHITND